MTDPPASTIAPPTEGTSRCEVCQGRPFADAGAKVKHYREYLQKHHGERAWTQQALADLTQQMSPGPERPGVTKDTIKSLENGTVRMPHRKTFEAIAKVFSDKKGVATDGTEIQDRNHCAFCKRSYSQHTTEPEASVWEGATAPVPRPKPRRGMVALAAGLAAVATLAAVSATARLQRHSAERRYAFLYGELFREGALLVLSAPPVYRYVNEGDSQWRGDHRFDAVSTIAISGEAVRPHAERSLTHAVRCATQYTGVGEAIAALEVQRVFMEVTGSAPQIATPDTAVRTRAHKISLGGWISNPASSTVADPMGSRAHAELEKALVFRTHDGLVYRADADGEKEFCRPEYEVVDGEVIPRTDYAIITRVREPVDGRVLIVVAGVNAQGTLAGGRLISSGVDRLRSWLSEKFEGRMPEAFQVLVKVPVERDARPGERVQLLEAVALDQKNP
jgi:hypothetical protein